MGCSFQNSSLFSCAAVAAACKLTKSSIDKNELLALSKSKRATLNKVLGDLLELDKAKNSTKKAPAVPKPKAGDLMSRVLADSSIVQNEKTSGEARPKRRKMEEDDDEDFEAWKREILKKAGAAVDQD